jgi:hypothetical protein
MIDKTRLRLFSFHRHQKRCDNKVFGDSWSQGIAYDLTIEEIFMGGTVKPALVCRDIGNVARPGPIR